MQKEFGWLRIRMHLVGCEIMVSKKRICGGEGNSVGWELGCVWLGARLCIGESAFGWLGARTRRFVGGKKERGPHGLDAGLERSRR